MKFITENGLRFFITTFLAAILFLLVFSFFVPARQISAFDAAKNTYRPGLINCAPGVFKEFFDGFIEEITINDNRKPAGEFRNGVYYINLEARIGYWYPETHDGDPIKIKAFAETGKPLQVPGPLIRIPAGTE